MKAKLSKKQKRKLNKLGRRALRPVAAAASLAAVFAAGLYSGEARNYLSSAKTAVSRKVRAWASALGGLKRASGVSGRAHPEGRAEEAAA
ncbi:hypothetical protein WMF27_23225 [Sorangium sp. So ce281]|uniref:hypothetical protein n=1 Tax=unclassified Sorangium TaxID=2621164 RepID=UPI003F5D99CD